LGLAERLCDRNADDVLTTQSDHLPGFAADAQLRGLYAEARAEQTVERRGRASALEVTEHGHAHLVRDAALELLGHELASATETRQMAFGACADRGHVAT